MTLTAGPDTEPPTTADGTGAFITTISAPSSVGTAPVTAQCGTMLAAPLTTVVVTAVTPATSTLGVLIFFVLLAVYALRRQYLSR